ncbi:TlpA family protein disulfide reductase [Thiorhodococcus mannitoliphagus]|uniref:TlpA family protein disulfide reductase n=1 Tax=Thiorhodococcus mannitoliphagus TaxID=329406 RepID=A0A6P1DY18_9GAMM|nr:TlpA family protein disulfide reductase [Thiorhodococcus mannitoliphagus]
MTFSKRPKGFIAVVPTLLLSFSVLAGGLMRVPGTPAAADFELMAPGGSVHRLADSLGRPLVLNFWATWCPPCRTEMPSLQRAYERLGEEGIDVLAIRSCL